MRHAGDACAWYILPPPSLYLWASYAIALPDFNPVFPLEAHIYFFPFCVFLFFTLLLEGPGRRTEPDAKRKCRAVTRALSSAIFSLFHPRALVAKGVARPSQRLALGRSPILFTPLVLLVSALPGLTRAILPRYIHVVSLHPRVGEPR